MELVYLWVEDYKNIKKQGFNFSPRFNCGYDEDSKELTIDENKDYIPYFFGENINVTAIVGKNGSGKSNVLEALICINAKGVAPWDNYKMCAVFFDKDNNLFCTSHINFNLKVKNRKDDVLKCKKEKKKPFLFHYNYTLDYIENEEQNIDFNKLYHKNDEYNTPVLLQPNKANREIDNWLMDYLANKDILNFMINKSISIENIEDFFIPTICRLDFSFSNIYKDKDKDSKIFKTLVNVYKTENVSYMTDISKLSKDKLIHLTRMYIVRKTIKNLDIVKDDEYKKCLKNLTGSIEYMETKSFESLYDNTISPHKIQKIKDSFLFIEYVKKQEKSYIINSQLGINDNKDLLLVLAPWIDIEFFNEKDISFKSLSYGQKFLIKFLYSILNQLNNIVPYDKYTGIILLLDEVELGLHPQWQKEYISLLIAVLNEYRKRYNFNIICSTHSAFILSDLPKENVIFLKDGKQDAGIKHKQTFGANIHTLLSDSFFMEDGLMGEFAKSKINEIIKILKSKRRLSKKNKKLCNDIIAIIGEPVLKNTLQNMFDEKLYSNESTIDKLKRKQKEIEEKLKIEELKGKSDEEN